MNKSRIFDAQTRDRRDLVESFRRMQLTREGVAALVDLAEQIHLGRIIPEHDLPSLLPAGAA